MPEKKTSFTVLYNSCAPYLRPDWPYCEILRWKKDGLALEFFNSRDQAIDQYGNTFEIFEGGYDLPELNSKLCPELKYDSEFHVDVRGHKFADLFISSAPEDAVIISDFDEVYLVRDLKIQGRLG